MLYFDVSKKLQSGDQTVFRCDIAYFRLPLKRDVVTAEFFQKLSQNLYDAMNKISSVSDSYKSFGYFYSDKKLQNEYVDKQKQVDKWDKYVADQEEKYYKQFTAMESAMSSLNSQQSYISQLFAG